VRLILAGYQAKIQAAFEELEAALASGDRERIKATDAAIDEVYVEISPSVAAAHLFFMRQMHGIGIRVDPSQLEIPEPGIPTYNWAHYGRADITEEEIDEVIRRRQPKKPADQSSAGDDDTPDT
jgi:hypothetical protein